MTPAGVENMKRWLSFKNESGEEIPPYAVIMLESDTTTDDTTPNFLGRLLFVQPDDVDANDPPKTFALNSASAVPDGEYGKCHFAIDAPVWGRIESGSGDSTWDVTDPSLDWVGQEWGPVDGQWDVNIDGKGFFIQGPPDLNNNRILVRQNPVSVSLTEIPGDCDCCPGCVCYPADDDDVTDECGAIGCLLKNYKIVSQELPFGGTRDLAWDTGCVFESDAFDVEICEEDYGSHFWRLTVASGCCATTLELINNGGTDVPLKYTNIRPFRMLCATEFAFEENCDLYASDELKSIAHTWPTKLCVNPVGSGDCQPCEVPPVTVCGCTLPQTLNMTITSSCGTVNGAVVPLVWDGVDTWDASPQPWVPGGTCPNPHVEFTFIDAGGGQCKGVLTAEVSGLFALNIESAAFSPGPSTCINIAFPDVGGPWSAFLATCGCGGGTISIVVAP